MNDHVPGKELFIWLTLSVFRERVSVYVCVSFPLRCEGGMWDLIFSSWSLVFFKQEANGQLWTIKAFFIYKRFVFFYFS